MKSKNPIWDDSDIVLHHNQATVENFNRPTGIYSLTKVV